MRPLHFAILFLVGIPTILYAGNTSLSERLKYPVYVVLSDDNEAYNDAVKTAIENAWTVSDYAFATHDEFKELKKSDIYVFMMLVNNESVDGSSSPYDQALQMFYMVRSGSYRTNITGVPLANLSKDNASLELLNAVRILQDKINFKIASEEENSQYANFEDAIKSRTGIVKTKKLYIAKEDLDNNLTSVDEIRNMYSGEVIIINKSEMQALMNAKNEEEIIYVSVGSFKNGLGYTSIKQVIDAQNGTVLYANETKGVKATLFNKSDFEKLNR